MSKTPGMVSRRLAALTLAAITAAGVPVPVVAQDKNSVEIVVRGCLKGRELTAAEISTTEEVPNLTGALFRLSTKGDLSKVVKQHDGKFVSVTGRVKKSTLAEPGIKLGGGRIVIGSGPMSTDPTRNPTRNPPPRIFPMEATDLTSIADSCPRY